MRKTIYLVLIEKSGLMQKDFAELFKLTDAKVSRLKYQQKLEGELIKRMCKELNIYEVQGWHYDCFVKIEIL